MSKKTLAVFGMVGLFASAGVAFAQTAAATPAAASQPMVLQVNTNGDVLMRGTISLVASDSLTVKSWGGEWTVQVPSSAKVIPAAPQGAALSGFQTGDFVGVLGTVDSNSNLTINARLVHDWSARRALTQQIRTNKQAARQTEAARSRVVQGVLSHLDATARTFTLTTARGSVYAVSLSSGAKTLARNWAALDFGTVKSGDTVRVYGTVSSSTISALVFRDVSIK